MKNGLQLGLVFCALLWAFVSAQDPTVSLAGVQDLSEYGRCCAVLQCNWPQLTSGCMQLLRLSTNSSTAANMPLLSFTPHGEIVSFSVDSCVNPATTHSMYLLSALLAITTDEF